MPRLPGCLFNFIKNQPPEVFILLMVYVQLYKKTEKLFLEISHKIHKENTCVLESLFKNLFKKRLWRSCFLVNFADFFSENTSCNLGDCQQMLLLFIDLSLTFLSELACQVAILYSLCQFYNLAIFYDSCSYLSSLLFLIPKTEFVSHFAFMLCSPFPAGFLLSTERFQTALLIKKYEALFSRLFLARQNATRIFRIILNIIAFYHSR